MLSASARRRRRRWSQSRYDTHSQKAPSRIARLSLHSSRKGTHARERVVTLRLLSRGHRCPHVPLGQDKERVIDGPSATDTHAQHLRQAHAAPVCALAGVAIHPFQRVHDGRNGVAQHPAQMGKQSRALNCAQYWCRGEGFQRGTDLDSKLAWNSARFCQRLTTGMLSLARKSRICLHG